MSVISELTKIAKAEVGNNGKKYRMWFYARTSDYYGVNWCAVFVSWIFSMIKGLDKYIIKSDGAGTLARCSDGKYGKWYEPNQITPREGDIVMFRWGGRTYTDKYHSDHVGYVYAVDNTYVYTIEGNTGSNNADYSTVMYKKYSLSNSCINGYYRPNYPSIKKESEETEMNFEKGDKSDGVLAYKALIKQADALDLIDASVDDSDSFGDGTYKATVAIQRKFNLEVDGVAGAKTITALRNAINEGLKSLQKPTQISNGWGIGIRFLKICLRVLHAKGVIKTKPDTKFGYGSGTNKAIKEFQTVAGIEVDGIAGEQTANAIEKYLMEG